MDKLCIQIQTHPPHFKYVNNLIQSIYEKTDIIELQIPIYIVFDNKLCMNTFLEIYPQYRTKCRFIHLESFIQNFDTIICEDIVKVCKDTIHMNWGAGAHRNYVAVKRSYSILELQRLGFDYVWCMDCESLFLDYVELKPILTKHIEKPHLLVGCKNTTGWKAPQIMNHLFHWDYSRFDTISIRMNDFWVIHTEEFSQMIQMLSQEHKRPLSWFMNGSEQAVYEYYIYYKYLNDIDSVNVVFIEGDFHGNTLFNSVIRSEQDLDAFAKKMNDSYFHFTRAYRGDYYLECMKHHRGQELMKKLDIAIAVSNYQQEDL